MERMDFYSTRQVYTELEDGTKVMAEKLVPRTVVPEEVAIHESYHGVACDGNFSVMTIEPSSEYSGMTMLNCYDPVAAAAPAAHKCDGVGSDIGKIRAGGYSPETMMSIARSKLSGKHEVVYELASIVQEEKTVGPSAYHEAVANVDNRSKGIFPIKMEIITPDGEVIQLETKSFKGEIKISDLYTPVSKAA